jgi:glycosyltransferase involved in cell wall biosynthesis
MLVVGRSGGEYDGLADQLPRIVLGRKGVSRVVPLLRREIDRLRPDVMFSIMDRANISSLLAARLSKFKPKTVACVQIPPSLEYAGPWWSRRAMLLRMIRNMYPGVDRIVALSQGVRQDLLSLNTNLERNCEIIYNAGVDERVLAAAANPVCRPPDGTPLLVACGRLTKQKGFPFLLDAMAKVHRHSPAHLWIVGEGEDRDSLERQIARLGLGECVRLPGFQSNPFRFMAAADVFVLSSLWEGFGNVIVEAMACDTAVVSTNCPYGPSEIISDGVNGILVPAADADALADQILRLLNDDRLRLRLAGNGKHRAMDFSAKTIARQYEELFQRLTGVESRRQLVA